MSELYLIPCPGCRSIQNISTVKSPTEDGFVMRIGCTACAYNTVFTYSSHTPSTLLDEIAADRWNFAVRKGRLVLE